METYGWAGETEQELIANLTEAWGETRGLKTAVAIACRSIRSYRKGGEKVLVIWPNMALVDENGDPYPTSDRLDTFAGYVKDEDVASMVDWMLSRGYSYEVCYRPA